MQPIGTLAHRSTNILTGSSRVAFQACENPLISATLPGFAVEVSFMDQYAGVSIRARGDLLGYPVVQRGGCVGGDNQSAGRGDGCGVGQNNVDGNSSIDIRGL